MPPFLAAEASHLADGERAGLGQHVLEAARGQELHDEARPALVVDHVEDRDRVGVLEACGDARLAHGPLPRRVGLGLGQADR